MLLVARPLGWRRLASLACAGAPLDARPSAAPATSDAARRSQRPLQGRRHSPRRASSRTGRPRPSLWQRGGRGRHSCTRQRGRPATGPRASRDPGRDDLRRSRPENLTKFAASGEKRFVRGRRPSRSASTSAPPRFGPQLRILETIAGLSGRRRPRSALGGCQSQLVDLWAACRADRLLPSGPVTRSSGP